jgi:hypothetical protein
MVIDRSAHAFIFQPFSQANPHGGQNYTGCVDDARGIGCTIGARSADGLPVTSERGASFYDRAYLTIKGAMSLGSFFNSAAEAPLGCSLPGYALHSSLLAPNGCTLLHKPWGFPGVGAAGSGPFREAAAVASVVGRASQNPDGTYEYVLDDPVEEDTQLGGIHDSDFSVIILYRCTNATSVPKSSYVGSGAGT